MIVIINTDWSARIFIVSAVALICYSTCCFQGVDAEQKISPKLIEDVNAACKALEVNREIPADSNDYVKTALFDLVERLHKSKIELASCDIKESGEMDLMVYSEYRTCTVTIQLADIIDCSQPKPNGPRIVKTCSIFFFRSLPMRILYSTLTLSFIVLASALTVWALLKLVVGRPTKKAAAAASAAAQDPAAVTESNKISAIHGVA